MLVAAAIVTEPIPPPPSYNPCMLHALQDLMAPLAPAAIERFTLWLNHVVSREPVATARLAPHAGRVLRLELHSLPAGLPLPALPPLVLAITRAGLFEWRGEGADVQDLTVRLDASRPDRLLQGLLAGERPAVQVEGDAALAGDIDWLIRHLRWDVADDVERLAGPLAAQAVSRAGEALAPLLAGLRRPAAPG